MSKIKIEIDTLQDTFIINEVEYQVFQKNQLLGLLDKLKDYQADITELKSAVTNILKLLGLLDEQTGTIKAAIQNGDESYLKHILKALTKVMSLLALAQVSPRSQRELEETFSFIKTIFPIIKKHGTQ